MTFDENPGFTDAYQRIRKFLDLRRFSTPCLVIDLQTVRERYLAIRDAFPDAQIFYAVKANAHPEILSLLARLDASFDVASVGEVRLCLAAGVVPERISFSNTIKKKADIAKAYELGIRIFTTDSEQDVVAIAEAAPGARVWGRVLIEPAGAATPFGKKFGCSPQMAIEIMHLASTLGLVAEGVTFHVGSQQLNPSAWDIGIAAAAGIVDKLGIADPVINLGGGFPTSYRSRVADIHAYSATINMTLRHHFGSVRPRIVLEPGRAIVGAAGVIRSEVILVSRKSHEDAHRWVYLDIGRYGGLAETEGEAIAYQLTTEATGPAGPVVIAGPTADGDDVLYQRTQYELPLSLTAGDHVDWLSTGAYTAAYASIAFNGFDPLPVHVVPISSDDGSRID